MGLDGDGMETEGESFLCHAPATLQWASLQVQESVWFQEIPALFKALANI